MCNRENCKMFNLYDGPHILLYGVHCTCDLQGNSSGRFAALDISGRREAASGRQGSGSVYS